MIEGGRGESELVKKEGERRVRGTGTKDQRTKTKGAYNESTSTAYIVCAA